MITQQLRNILTTTIIDAGVPTDVEIDLSQITKFEISWMLNHDDVNRPIGLPILYTNERTYTLANVETIRELMTAFSGRYAYRAIGAFETYIVK